MKRTHELLQPTVEQVKEEIKRVNYQRKFQRMVLNSLYTLVVVAAFSILLSTAFLPVLKIYGSSMTPTICEGEIVVVLKGTEFQQGDIVGLWYGNKLLVKRIIACPGQWVNIDPQGNVYVDELLLEEPYLQEKQLGDCNIEMPCQIQEDRFFVLGDHRSISQDSRNTVVGNIPKDQISGKVVFRIWPFEKFGTIK